MTERSRREDSLMGPGRVEKADYIKETAKKYGRAYGIGAGGGALRGAGCRSEKNRARTTHGKQPPGYRINVYIYINIKSYISIILTLACLLCNAGCSSLRGTARG